MFFAAFGKTANADVVFEGRLVNRTQGTYKGYPLAEKEWPDGIESIYGET